MTDDMIVEDEVELRINPDATFDDWKNMGHYLMKGTQGLCWAWGKWWELGHQKWNREAVEFVDNELPLVRKTISTYASVWKAFPKSTTRVALLTFKHHRAVLGLRSDEKKMHKWLQKAVDNKWTSEELRLAIQGKKPTKTGSIRLTPNKLEELCKEVDNIAEYLAEENPILIPLSLARNAIKRLQAELTALKK